MSISPQTVSEDTIPVIDVAPLISGGAAGRRQVAAEIGASCREIGFFVIRNHPISQTLLDEVFAQSARFFGQSIAVKERVSIALLNNNRGYVAMEGEALDPSLLPDLKEAFNIGREPDSVTQEGGSLPTNLWPDLAGFREPLYAYYEACRQLCVQLHVAFAIDLGLNEDFFGPFVDRPMATLRLLHYPPHPGPFDGTRYGAGPHTDYGNLTLLAQGAVGGLEVQSRGGRWIRVEPMRGALICNVGDCLMRWSNDVYASTPHRVVNRGGEQRYSVAFFFDPNADAVIECLPTCTSPERPPRYATTTGGEYLKSRLDATYEFRRADSN